MGTPIKLSEAASLAVHTGVYLASKGAGPVTTGEIAEWLKASEAHLSKVLQRLVKAGLVKSIRGPNGGFVLGRPAEEVALLDVYEAIEGPLEAGTCLFDGTPCDRKKCIMGDLLGTMNREIRDYLTNTRLSDLKE